MSQPVKRTRFLVTLGLALGSSGCLLTSDLPDPALDVPAGYKAAGRKTALDAPPPLDWWRGFRSGELTSLMEEAQAANLDIAVAIAQVRIRCALALAPFDIAQAFKQLYQANENPRIDDLASSDGTPTTVAGHWSQSSVETFPVFDLAAQALVDDEDSLRVSWFATVELAATSMDADHAQAELATLPTLPPGQPVHVWMVLRDARGGVDVRHTQIAGP